METKNEETQKDDKKAKNTGCTAERRYVGSALAEELVLSLIRAHSTAE
jgi:hypothetical protein